MFKEAYKKDILKINISLKRVHIIVGKLDNVAHFQPTRGFTGNKIIVIELVIGRVWLVWKRIKEIEAIL